VEAERALSSLDLRIQGMKDAGRRLRRPRWYEVALLLLVLLVGAWLIYFGWRIGFLPIPLILVLALVTIAPGLLLVLVSLRHLARTITSLFAAEAGSSPRREDAEDDAGPGPSA
jgi:hypothetical protein